MHYNYSPQLSYRKNLSSGTLYQTILSLIAFFSFVYIFIFERPENGYNLICLLPLTYIFFSFISRNCWGMIPQNFGITILYSLEFIRLVVSPMLVAASGYYCVIFYRAEVNNGKGILLLIYEAICIGLALRCKSTYRVYQFENINDRNANSRMNFLMIFIIVVTVGVCILAPEILSGYRTIAGLFTDVLYTSIEGVQISAEYTTSSKFLVVTGNYILKVVRLLVPAYILVILRNRLSRAYKIICYAVILSPFLFVDGTIARSIFYTIFLLMIYYQLYGKDMKKMMVPVVIAAILVVVYFVARFFVGGGIGALNYFADKSIDYFAGANVVGGVFNLPTDFEHRFHYHLYDLLRTVPYANTIFGLNSSDYLQRFFNINNHVNGGQIPPTIGMSSYYLSTIFAPFYSVIFARLCKKYGEKARLVDHPYYRLIYTYISFISALGICMYSIDITLITLAQVIFPIFIVIHCSYKRIKEI